VQAVERTSLALFTSTNPNGKLFTNLKPILGTGTVPVPEQQAGRQAGRQKVGWLLSDSQVPLALPLPRVVGKRGIATPLARKPYCACSSIPHGSWLELSLSLLV
jgi:hypothetical protein